MGVAAFTAETTSLLVNRLRMEDDIKRHPEILDEPITKPLVIIGVPRAGSSSSGPPTRRRATANRSTARAAVATTIAIASGTFIRRHSRRGFGQGSSSWRKRGGDVFRWSESDVRGSQGRRRGMASEITRRQLLHAGATGGAALAATSLASNPVLARALATPARCGKLTDIEHVVILMQENRSFDHYFGTLRGVRGFDDPDGLFRQPDPLNPDGYLLPFHLDTHRTKAQQIPTTAHEWDVQHQAWNGGKMDAWLPAHRAADRQTLYFSAHASLDRAAARLWHLEKWRERFRSVPALTWLIRKFLFFALEWRVLSFLGDRVVREHADAIARRHLESSVSDPQLRAALTAHYQMGCKRILLSADFYPVFQRPNVELLTERIAEIRERSVVTEDGAERPVDVLIYLNPASRSPFFADLPGKARFSPGMFAAVDDSRQK